MRSTWFVIAVAFLAGCAPLRNQQGGNRTAGAPSSGEQSSEQAGAQIGLTLHKVMDTTGTEKLAGTYLLPEGYTATDEIKWLPNDYLTPVVGSSTIKSNDGSVVMESMSGLQINFGHGPAGSFGTAPPDSVCEFLLSSWKKEHSGLKYTVVSRKDSGIPEAKQTGNGFKMFGKRGVLKLQYPGTAIRFW